MPRTSAPASIPARTTARIAAFIPGASPPLVRTPIRFTRSSIAHARQGPQARALRRDRRRRPGAGRARAGRRGLLPPPAGDGDARADAHLARLPRGAVRLQDEEGRPLPVPRLLDARASRA